MGIARRRKNARGDGLPSLRSGPPLGREVLVVLAVTALGAALVYVLFVHKIRNTRPLGGRNTVVAPHLGTQSEAAFAVDPGRPRVMLGALGASGELVGNPGSLAVVGSTDGGLRWHRTASPDLQGGCFYAGPRAAFDASGREYLAFLAGPCEATLTPFLVVSSRPRPDASWSEVARVAPRVGRWGFDDGPSLAIDSHSGRVYLAWARGLNRSRIVTVVSSSDDHGKTWSPPRIVSPSLVDPHLASLAVGADGSLYLAGIDAAHGLWIARSTDEGRTFSAPRPIVSLLENPSQAECGLSIDGPLPFELTRCIGPNPTLLVHGDRVDVVYDDIGPNRTEDVFVVGLDRSLHVRFHGRVNPPDSGSSEQFFPVAAVDPQTGVLGACWYDTTFDPRGHRAWFTCSHSRTGRVWTKPDRAAAAPTSPDDLYRTLPITPSLVAERGRLHAFWPDGRNYTVGIEVYSAALTER